MFLLLNLSQPLEILKKINLMYSENLVELRDLSLAKNLQKIVLIGCENLCVVHPSIFSLSKFRELNLESCGNLTYLKSDIVLKSISCLLLSGCWRLKEFSVTSENMIKLDLSNTSIEELPLSIGCLGRLEDLKLGRCKKLTHLPSNLVDLTSLRSLRISHCQQLRSLPQLPPSIQELRAICCEFLKPVQFSMVDGIPFNNNLVSIWFKNCEKLDEHSRNAIGLTARPNLKNYADKSAEERKELMTYDIEGISIYLGRKVPRWFKHRTQQGSITFSPCSKLLGFIFCFILGRQTGYFKVYWFLENNNDDERLNLFDLGGYTDDGILSSEGDDEFFWGKGHHVYIFYADCNGLVNERIEKSKGNHQNPPTLTF